MSPMIPAKIDPTQISTANLGQWYPGRLEEILSSVRSAAGTLLSQHPKLKERERQRLVGVMASGLGFLATEIRSMTENRGQLEEFNEELRAVIPDINESDDPSEHYQAILDGVMAIYGVTRRWLETLGLVVGMTEPLKADTVDEIWYGTDERSGILEDHFEAMLSQVRKEKTMDGKPVFDDEAEDILEQKLIPVRPRLLLIPEDDK